MELSPLARLIAAPTAEREAELTLYVQKCALESHSMVLSDGKFSISAIFMNEAWMDLMNNVNLAGSTISETMHHKALQVFPYRLGVMTSEFILIVYGVREAPDHENAPLPSKIDASIPLSDGANEDGPLRDALLQLSALLSTLPAPLALGRPQKHFRTEESTPLSVSVRRSGRLAPLSGQRADESEAEASDTALQEVMSPSPASRRRGVGKRKQRGTRRALAELQDGDDDSDAPILEEPSPKRARVTNLRAVETAGESDSDTAEEEDVVGGGDGTQDEGMFDFPGNARQSPKRKKPPTRKRLPMR
ncbi:hypothetical protein J8273_8082 [Carpediemonas membranifera]|uniref:Uncharacterized protein n=1 Tax=Carpediemonas membranifera TaxID=201153 RepID=A0A8J6AS26_9EUKA|nr:hypothetical protein J8273_8082 [Carpediemonas membranifera]|eukprot:KAG9390045.1 hypothetical protein J8273_8082 [Carpediemonas membranifera]